MAETLHLHPTGVLAATRPRALTIQAVLVLLAAFALPAAVHAVGLPVRWLLPMHWPILFIGLAYGWRSGLIAGMLAPLVSFLLSGHPLPLILPSMIVELGMYGFVAGVLVEVLRVNRFVAMLLAVLGGRIVFIATAMLTGAAQPALGVYLTAALLPGIPAAIAQVILLPLAARRLIDAESRR